MILIHLNIWIFLTLQCLFAGCLETSVCVTFMQDIYKMLWTIVYFSFKYKFYFLYEMRWLNNIVLCNHGFGILNISSSLSILTCNNLKVFSVYCSFSDPPQTQLTLLPFFAESLFNSCSVLLTCNCFSAVMTSAHSPCSRDSAWNVAIRSQALWRKNGAQCARLELRPTQLLSAFAPGNDLNSMVWADVYH